MSDRPTRRRKNVALTHGWIREDGAVYCPPNVDCPCYKRLVAEVERLGLELDKAEASFHANAAKLWEPLLAREQERSRAAAENNAANLRKARNDALEEAARTFDEKWGAITPDEVAASIRSLKDTHP